MRNMKIRPKYLMDKPPGTLKNRVFIGGNYSLGSRIEDIADVVRDCGYQPIIVWEFDILPGTERHSSKQIVKQCKYAIFEVSSNAGHFFEMDDAEEYSLNCLCLWDAHQGSSPNVSTMVQSHPVFLSNNKPYRNTRELQYLVYDFLRSLNSREHCQGSTRRLGTKAAAGFEPATKAFLIPWFI